MSSILAAIRDEIRFRFIWLLATLFRFVPWPTRTRLIEVGSPDETSPVFLTGNYILTVERVKRALRGLNAYLIVANSHGINVWCAATGGHFTNSSVISALKLSGIADKVNTRTVIMPQLAATGIERKVINEKIKWSVKWGPIDAAAIPQYLSDRQVNEEAYRLVRFPLSQRLEMALAWWTMIAIFVFFIFLVVNSELIGWGLVVTLVVSIGLFVLFPYYREFLDPSKKGISMLSMWLRKLVISVVLVMLWALAYPRSGWHVPFSSSQWRLLAWTIWTVTMVLFFDLMGSTPVYRSESQPERRYKVVLDKVRCEGVGTCEVVCPKRVFHVIKGKTASMPNSNACIQCGACIVQCPRDALHFENEKGEIIPPENTRTYKLNMMGKRTHS